MVATGCNGNELIESCNHGDVLQGAKSGGDAESAQAKNKALADAGAIVPTSFEGLEATVKVTYEKLVQYLKPCDAAKKLNFICVPSNFSARIRLLMLNVMCGAASALGAI